MTESQHLEKMISTRIEVSNIDSIDKLARGLGISRSAWIRQAILAELVLELREMRAEEEEPQISDVHPAIVEFADLGRKMTLEEAMDEFTEVPRETSSDEESVVVSFRSHDILCVKSIDHEGDCLD